MGDLVVFVALVSAIAAAGLWTGRRLAGRVGAVADHVDRDDAHDDA